MVDSLHTQDQLSFCNIVLVECFGTALAIARLTRSGGLRPKLFLDYATGAHTDEVPDPYYGAGDGFEICFELIENAVNGLLKSHFNIRS